MAISPVKKVWNLFSFCIVMGGFPLLAWVGYHFATETYAFSKHGISKTAEVVSLQHKSSSRSGLVYMYELEIDGTSSVKRFTVRLPVGKTVSVLTLPEKPDEVIPGSEESTWFDIYSYLAGGRLLAGFSFLLYGFMITMGPRTFLELWRIRHAWLNT